MASPARLLTSSSPCWLRPLSPLARHAYATEAPLPPSHYDALPPNKQRRLDSTSADSTRPALAPTSSQNKLNRTGAIDPSLHNELREIVRSFRAPIRHAFAYGSAVFKQAGYSEKDKPMIDFIFAVSEPVHWHALNLRQNGHHYASLPRLLGSSFVSHVQQRYGARAWFNVECEVHGRLIKYGVISVKHLCDDLRDWETLYMSGRMQKPIHVLRDDARIRLNEEINLKSAFRTALLLLPERFTEVDLYRQITSLSYSGDFRMRVGENPGKIGNIVSAQYERFQTLYAPFFTSSSFSSVLSRTGDDISLDTSPRARGLLARKLPLGVKDKVRAMYAEKSEGMTETDEVAMWTRLAKDESFKGNLAKSLEKVVAGPAFYQSLKGVVSVGPTKGLRYVGPKLRKKWLKG